jgi:porphobilinogen synthase
MSFPRDRLRRLRKSAALRDMVRETRLSRSDFVLPLFVVEGSGVREAIVSMPGVSRFSVDQVVDEAKRVADLGVPAVILFGIPTDKDARGSGADAADGIVQRAASAIKAGSPDLCVITDVCLCEYTDHGHCGIVEAERVLNDPSVARLAQTALSHARAGADLVAPSDMMDGRVAAIRSLLDEHDFEDVPIMSYAAKYSSAFYGPFRDAAESTPQFGDRRSYQMDPPNRREAMREMKLDLEEGADMLMVKPALAYLDVIRAVREASALPLAAYNVSGEYSAVKAAAERGWMDEAAVVRENLHAMARAGADIIITYHAREALEHGWL